MHVNLRHLAAAVAVALAAPPAPFTVKIIGFNDYHGNLESPGSFGANSGVPVAQRPAVPLPEPLPAAAIAVGNAVLAADGRSALAPAASVDATKRLWLRNGMGQGSAARVVERLEVLGLVRLALDTPLPVATGLTLVARAPYAGSPGTLVEFGASGDAAPAWPQLRQGFFGRGAAPPGVSRALGIAAPNGPRGGPVFDAAGRFAGVVVPGDDGIDRLVAASAVAVALGFEVAVVPAATAAALPLDAVDELALRNTLQLIAER